MNKIANRQVICETLMERAKTDKDIVVLCRQRVIDTICTGISGTVCGSRNCGTGFSRDGCRSCKM